VSKTRAGLALDRDWYVVIGREQIAKVVVECSTEEELQGVCECTDVHVLPKARGSFERSEDRSEGPYKNE